jgi:serine/threonine protein kinase
MEFMSGGNLAFHLEKIKQFYQVQVNFFAGQIVCGLSFLHDKGFIHW